MRLLRNRPFRALPVVLFQALVLCWFLVAADAPAEPFLAVPDAQWGGHIKLRGSASRVDDRSLYGLTDSGTYLDWSFEGRLTNRTFFSDHVHGEVHYEAILSGGKTSKAQADLGRRFPDFFSESSILSTETEDDRRFLDLTRTLRQRDGYSLTHRLDRLFLAFTPGRTAIRIGRQAVTWGNGLLFNPMDLVNPFAPSDIEREYKIGDDMISARVPLFKTGEAQAIYVPRRSVESGEVEWDRSSLAVKVHFSSGIMEFDILGALHYGGEVIGMGVSGYAGSAVWRMDATWTFLEDRRDRDGFLSMAINMDYSWVWWNRNIYGFLEFHYSGIGERDPAAAFDNEALMDRVARGEVHALGRYYLAGHISVELHPLLNVLLTLIHRLDESSGLIQPRAVWDLAHNIQITAGAAIPYGKTGTEFKGFPVPGTDRLTPAPARAFLYMTYYF